MRLRWRERNAAQAQSVARSFPLAVDVPDDAVFLALSCALCFSSAFRHSLRSGLLVAIAGGLDQIGWRRLAWSLRTAIRYRKHEPV